MKITSYLWNKMGEENTGRNLLAVVTLMFFGAIFFVQDLTNSIILAVFFVVYMATTLSLDNVRV